MIPFKFRLLGVVLIHVLAIRIAMGPEPNYHLLYSLRAMQLPLLAFVLALSALPLSLRTLAALLVPLALLWTDHALPLTRPVVYWWNFSLLWLTTEVLWRPIARLEVAPSSPLVRRQDRWSLKHLFVTLGAVAYCLVWRFPHINPESDAYRFFDPGVVVWTTLTALAAFTILSKELSGRRLASVVVSAVVIWIVFSVALKAPIFVHYVRTDGFIEATTWLYPSDTYGRRDAFVILVLLNGTLLALRWSGLRLVEAPHIHGFSDSVLAG